MDCLRYFRFVFLYTAIAVAVLGALCAPLAAQAGKEVPATPLKPKPVHEAALPPLPFAVEGDSSQAQAVEWIAAERMSEQDRKLATEAEAAIARAAGFAGLDFRPGAMQQGAWSSRQLVCTALPGHLFLEFARASGSGNASIFTASIPRGGEKEKTLGQVRIIPIERRGYSPFSPAPVNAQSIAVFNRIRAEEKTGKSADWLATSLCYAALTGARTRLATREDSRRFPAAMGAGMEIAPNGDAVIHFAEESAARPTQWRLDFDSKGKLLKVALARAPLLTAEPVPATKLKSQDVPRN